MDLKAFILLAVCSLGHSQTTQNTKQPPTKKSNEKHIRLLHQHNLQMEKLNQLLKRNHKLDQLASQSSSSTVKSSNLAPLGREQLPLPLVLSPENLHDMDLNPAISVVSPPKSVTNKEKTSRGHKKTSDVSRRQVHYDAAIASLLGDALKAAAFMQPAPLDASHEIPLQPAPPVYHQSATVHQPLALVQAPEPLAQKHAPVTFTQAIIKPQFVLKKEHYTANNDDHDEFKDYAAKYKFGYRVVDTHTGNDFGQTESRDGGLTTGHYHVVLPDGRLQTVQYWSDLTGYHAHISYDGHAVHI